MARPLDAQTQLHVLLATLGSAGDVYPMVELGVALKARGHRATIATNSRFRDFALRAELEFIALGTEEEYDAIVADPRLWSVPKAFECLTEGMIVPNISRLYGIIAELQSERLVVAASGLCFGARLAQEKLGVPLATVHLQPALLRSVVDCGNQGRVPLGPHVPAWFKRALFGYFDAAVVNRSLGAKLNELRAALGLGHVGRILWEYLHSPQLVLGLFPEWFGPLQPDWPANTHLVGFVLHQERHSRHAPQAVEEFLAQGPPPVLFTPGSEGASMRPFFTESVAACRASGMRGLMVTNYPQQLPRELPPGVMACSFVPFGEVFPRCSAVVHPGGIGTMAQAVRAGIPQLVVPHSNDQPDNAHRIARLGLGARIYPERYKAKSVARILRELVSSRDTRNRCQQFAAAIDSEFALEHACDLIESLSPSQPGMPDEANLSLEPVSAPVTNH